MFLIYNKRKHYNHHGLRNKVIYYMFLVSMCASFTACHESIEKRAQREAREYTERNCPTPIINSSRTDSVTFDIDTKTYTYYCSFFDRLDNAEAINKNYKQLNDGFRDLSINNTSLKVFVEAGFTFKYIVRSGSNPETILFQGSYKK